MAFTLPSLPYAHDALAASGMCRETLELHHGKHHQAYVTALNGFIDKDPKLQGRSLEEIVQLSWGKPELAGVFNNAGQIWNHNLFWPCMKPNGGGALPGRLAAKVASDFGSTDAFKEAFRAAGTTQFGSGWAWLVVGRDGRLACVKTPNGSNPLAEGQGTAILGCDVWEHSYYLDFRNRRPDYLANFLDKLVNWEHVESLLAKA